jgi:hypothetical protein
MADDNKGIAALRARRPRFRDMAATVAGAFRQQSWSKRRARLSLASQMLWV